MSDPRFPDLATSPIRASVSANGVTTSYLGAGRGAAVVLLVEPEWTPPLFALLADRFRVLVPEVPAVPAAAADPSGRVALCRWLRAFFDGLGLERASLVAGALHGGTALSFALLEEERVERLVLLEGSSVHAGRGGEGEVATACPRLLLRTGAGSLAAVEAARRFLLARD